jgi:hypothetical protein
LLAAAGVAGCRSVPREGLFVYHDPEPRGGAVAGRAKLVPQTLVFRTARSAQEGVGALAVETGAVEYRVEEEEERERAARLPPREERLSALGFAKPTSIYSLAPDEFAMLVELLEANGLDLLPRHPGGVPPPGEPYYLLQLGADPPRIYLKPDPTDLSLRVQSRELSRQDAQAIADAWASVKQVVYTSRPWSPAPSPRTPLR